MKYTYIYILLLLSYIGNAQDSIKVVSFGSMNDFHIASSEKNELIINFEFAPLSEDAKLSIDIYNLSENTEIKLFDNILVETLKKRENTTIYTSIEQNEKDVIIKNTLTGVYLMMYPIKAKSKKINIFPFKPKANMQDQTVPIILLMDNKIEKDINVMKTISNILNCHKLEDIKKNDIEYLKKRANILKIITYKIESIK